MNGGFRDERGVVHDGFYNGDRALLFCSSKLFAIVDMHGPSYAHDALVLVNERMPVTCFRCLLGKINPA